MLADTESRSVEHLGRLYASKARINDAIRAFGGLEGFTAEQHTEYEERAHRQHVADGAMGGAASTKSQGEAVVRESIRRRVLGGSGSSSSSSGGDASDHTKASCDVFEGRLRRIVVALRGEAVAAGDDAGEDESRQIVIEELEAALADDAVDGRVLDLAVRCAAEHRGELGYNADGGLSSRTTEQRSADGQRGSAAGLAGRSSEQISADGQRGYNADGGLSSRTTEQHSADSQRGGYATAAIRLAKQGKPPGLMRTYLHTCGRLTNSASEPNPRGVNPSSHGGLQPKVQSIPCKHCRSRNTVKVGGTWELLGNQPSNLAKCDCGRCNLFVYERE
jgi:hypothetical protein